MSSVRDEAIERAVGRGASEADRDRARQAWAELGDLRHDPDYAALLGGPTLRERIAAGLRRPMVWAPLAAAACAAVVTLALLWPSAPTARYATAVAETRDLKLGDGSLVALGAESALKVGFTARERHVDMAPGEAFFEVAHDASRPFVIRAGETVITVVGTRFNVKYDDRGVRVSVLEGEVRVGPAALGAGQTAAIPAGGGAPAVTAQPLAQPGAWRSGQLYYDDAPLAEIVADLNRYVPGEIRLSDPRLGSERLTTSFRADQARQFLESLPEVLPVRLDGQVGEEVVLARK